MRLVMVARDVAPANALESLFAYIRESGVVDTHGIFGYGKPFDASLDAINNLVGSATVVLLGMSSLSSLSREELFAAEVAYKFGIPFGFYSDTFGTFRRPWFENYREKANFLFVINEDEARSAKELFPKARIVVSGNPLWENFFFPKKTRKAVRGDLTFTDDDRVILCPGGKNLTVNLLHLGGVIEAVSRMDKDHKHWYVLFSKHPGDPNSTDAYGDLVKYSRSPLRVVTKEEFSGSDMISGADVVIESASTMGIEAACQRIPVIEYFSEIALNRLEEANGIREWELVKLGAAREVRGNITDLFNTILDLLLYGGDKKLREVQERVFPKPAELGTSLKIMTEVLKEFSGL